VVHSAVDVSRITTTVTAAAAPSVRHTEGILWSESESARVKRAQNMPVALTVAAVTVTGTEIRIQIQRQEQR
jgi:hypothetical protein